MDDNPRIDDAALPPQSPEPPVAANLETILSIPVVVQVVLGSTSLPVSALMKLGRGAVVQLDQKLGEPVDVVVNGRVVARGEIVIVDEETSRYGVSLTQVVSDRSKERA